MTRCGTPSRAAIAAQSRLWRLIELQHGARLPEPGDALVEAGEVGRVDEPHAAARRERVRCALHRRRLGRDPAEAVVALVADRDPAASIPSGHATPRRLGAHAPGVESRLPCCGRGSGGGSTGPLWGERKERSVRKSYLLALGLAAMLGVVAVTTAGGGRASSQESEYVVVYSEGASLDAAGRRSRPPEARSCRRTPRSASRP